MSLNPQFLSFEESLNSPDEPEACQELIDEAKSNPPTEPEKVLCPHCLRTATNGIKCKGICVADSDY